VLVPTIKTVILLMLEIVMHGVLKLRAR